jgi:hypothetical protein
MVYVFARGVATRRRAARARATVLGLLLGSVAALACSGSSVELMNSTSDDPPEVPPWACVPGETQPCPCAEGLEGLRTCDPQGSGFGECDCSPGAVSQGPPATSTDTDTGTGSGTADTGTGPGDTTDPTPGSTGEPDPTTSGGSSGAPDPTTSGGSTGGSSSG